MESLQPLALVRDHVIATEILQRIRPFWIKLNSALFDPSQRTQLPPEDVAVQEIMKSPEFAYSKFGEFRKLLSPSIS